MTTLTLVTSDRPPAVERAAPPSCHPSPPPPLVVAHVGGRGRSLHTAADVARRTGAVLHVVIPARRSASPWAALLGRASTTSRPTQLDRVLGGCGHVEVHATTGRPGRLAREIATTVGGVVLS